MPSYPTNVSRCHHIKVNGIQCGSPAIRESTYCFYHMRYHWPALQEIEDRRDWQTGFPSLEDANSIQIELAKMIEMIRSGEIDLKAAALVLYALQTASMNLKRTSLEPELPTQVVIDRESVARRPIGASAWSAVEGREYDDLGAADVASEDLESEDQAAESEPITSAEPDPKSNGNVVKSLEASIAAKRKTKAPDARHQKMPVASATRPIQVPIAVSPRAASSPPPTAASACTEQSARSRR